MAGQAQAVRQVESPSLVLALISRFDKAAFLGLVDASTETAASVIDEKGAIGDRRNRARQVRLKLLAGALLIAGQRT
jgi:hypothetical protein